MAKESSRESSDAVFFTYIDDEEAREGIRWPSLPPVRELAQRFDNFRAYLDRQPLSPTERQVALDAYEGYLLVKYAFSTLPRPAAQATIE